MQILIFFHGWRPVGYGRYRRWWRELSLYEVQVSRKNIVSYNKRWKWAPCCRGRFKYWTVPHSLLMGICNLKVETWCRFLISVLHARKEYRYSKIPQIRQWQLPSIFLISNYKCLVTSDSARSLNKPQAIGTYLLFCCWKIVWQQHYD